jgi:hypothetical protein
VKVSGGSLAEDHMAAVVYLQPGEALPANENCVLVRRDLKGVFTASRSAEGFGDHLASLGRDVVIAVEKAAALAEGIGAETVLVVTDRAADKTPLMPWLQRSL